MILLCAWNYSGVADTSFLKILHGFPYFLTPLPFPFPFSFPFIFYFSFLLSPVAQDEWMPVFFLNLPAYFWTPWSQPVLLYQVS